MASVQCIYDSSYSWGTSDLLMLAVLARYLGKAEGLIIGPYAEEKDALVIREKGFSDNFLKGEICSLVVFKTSSKKILST